MHKNTLAVCLVLMIVSFVSSSSAQEPAKTVTGLPAELSGDVETMTVPTKACADKPFSFSKLKSSTSSTLSGFTTRKATERAEYSFTIGEDRVPRWASKCKWSGARIDGRDESRHRQITNEIHLDCDLTPQTGAEHAAALQFHQSGTFQGRVLTIGVAEGKLTDAVSELHITRLFEARNSRLLGDITSGYVFFEGEKPIAALQLQSQGGCSDFFVKRDLTADRRLLLITAASAMAIGDELVERVSNVE